MASNDRTQFITIGARNQAITDREEHDFYATDPEVLEKIYPQLHLSHNVWEPACGQGHLSEVLVAHGHNVRSTDLIDRGYGQGGIDFFETNEQYDGDILTNPPYGRLALPFVKHALETVTDGHKVVCLLKLTFLEGIERGDFYKDFPPHYVYVSRSRVSCPLNADFATYRGRTAISYAWYVWEKGYKGETTLRWFN